MCLLCEGSVGIMLMHRLVCAFDAPMCNKYHTHMYWLKYGCAGAFNMHLTSQDSCACMFEERFYAYAIRILIDTPMFYRCPVKLLVQLGMYPTGICIHCCFLEKWLNLFVSISPHILFSCFIHD